MQKTLCEVETFWSTWPDLQLCVAVTTLKMAGDAIVT